MVPGVIIDVNEPACPGEFGQRPHSGLRLVIASKMAPTGACPALRSTNGRIASANARLASVAAVPRGPALR
jgi:hypothetical protein